MGIESKIVALVEAEGRTGVARGWTEGEVRRGWLRGYRVAAKAA